VIRRPRASFSRGAYVPFRGKGKLGAIMMTGFKTLGLAALMAIVPAAALAEEPAAYASQNPDRDVLNRGELTPAGKLVREGPNGTASLLAANRAAAGLPPLPSSRTTR
jgi:hypothetical protein